MAKIIDWFPKIIFCKIPEIIIEMIPNAGIIKMWTSGEPKVVERQDMGSKNEDVNASRML